MKTAAGDDSDLGPEYSIEVKVTDTPDDQWSVLLSSDSHSGYFQTEHWIVSACTHYPESTPVFIHAFIDGRLVGGLAAVCRYHKALLPGGRARMQNLQSSLEGTSGGPVLTDNLNQQQRECVFLDLINAYRNLQSGLLSRCAVTLAPGHEEYFGHLLTPQDNWHRQDVSTAVIPLQGGVEQVELRTQRSKRKERTRGLKRGAEFFVTKDLAHLEAYYPIYLSACQVWGVTPVPLLFLRDLLNGPTELNGVPCGAFFTCVRLEKQIIGGHFCLHYRDRVMAWNGVTDPAFANSHFPATLAIWSDFTEACLRGADYLDVGTSGSSDSLMVFKKLFGARLQVRGHYVSDTAAVKLIDGGRSLLGSLKNFARGSAGKTRWHDGKVPKIRQGTEVTKENQSTKT